MASNETIASVLYADLSGFTAISEKLDPEDVTTLMNRCFEALEAAVIGHGGTVNQYIGDCLLAIFGLDETPQDSAHRAVAAAIEMQRAIAEINRQGGVPGRLEIHIGIATGSVVVGEVGGSLHRELTVTGDTVALAERLEEVSAAGEILVGPRTFEATREDYDYREREPVRLPGDDVPVAVYAWSSLRHRRALIRRGSERRQATVVFARLAGFERSRHLSNEAATAMLNRFFAAAEAAVIDNGGTVDKYIGTTLMALFGVPRAIEDAPQCAVNAALELRERIAHCSRKESLAAPVEVQIGINTGLVIAGEVGGRIRRDFTVTGDTVNLAARFAGMCPPGSIYIGAATHAGAPGAFTTRELPAMLVKGRTGAVPLYEVLGHTASSPPRARRAERARASSSPLVGRRRELEELRRDAAALARGQGGVTSLVGEAGLGKSRLLAEIADDPSLAGCLTLEVHASPIGTNLSFAPVVDLLRRWAGIRESDDEDTARQRLERAVATVSNRPAEVIPLVARMMGFDARAETSRIVDPDAIERLIFKSVRDLVHDIAARQPLLFVFEDLHWADESSRTLLGTLLRSCVDHPIRFVLTYRPQNDELVRFVDTSLGSHSGRHRNVRLSPLDTAATGTLVDHLLGTDEVPASLRRLIAEKSEGNPFFVEEVVRSLIEQQALVLRDGRHEFVGAVETVQIPGTIEEVVMSRIDRLDEPLRHSLQAAAVIGRSFTRRVLAEILRRQGYSSDDLEHDLNALVERRLLVAAGRATGSGDVEYLFQHALARETIYESLLQQTRRELHAIVAETLESLFRDRLTDVYGMLALHYSRSGNLAKAEDYLFRAGEVASRSAATREALAFFQEASRLYLGRHGDGGDPYKKALLENQVGIALLGRGQLSESLEHFDTALDHLGARAPESGVRLQLRFAGDLVAALARLYLFGGLGRGNVSATDKLVFNVAYNRTRALTTSDPQRLFIDNVGAIRRVTAVDARQVEEAFGIYVMAATLFGWSGRAYGIAKRFARVAATLVQTANVGDVFVSRFLNFGLTYLEGDWAPEHVLDDELVDRALQGGRFWDVQTYLGLACDRLLRRGEFARADEHLDHLAEIRDVYEYGFAGTNHDGMSAVLNLEARRFDRARAAVDAYESQVYEDPLRVLAYGTRAKIETLLGNFDAAAAALDAAERTIERSQVIPPWHLSAYTTSRLLFDLLAYERNGSSNGAKRVARSCRRALGVAKQVALTRVETHRLAARWEWLRGRRRRAMRHWSQALAAGRRLGAMPEMARTWIEAGRRLEGSSADVGGMRPSDCIRAGEATLAQLGIEPDGQSASTLPLR